MPAGEEVAERINALAASGDYELVVATRDWHPPDHGSFAAQGGIWPVHCVAGTPGAELHPALDRADRRDRRQGPGRDTDGYSGFERTGLAETLLRERGDHAGHRRRPGDRLLRQEHRARRAARGLGVRVDRRAVRGVEVAARRLRARPRGARPPVRPWSLIKVSLTVLHGKLTLARTTGLTFLSGDGKSDRTITFRGTIAAINAALDGLKYEPDKNYVGSDSLKIVTNDLGSGIGNPITDTDSVGILVEDSKKCK